MEKKAKVPKLRFPGFTGEWEERKLGDLSEKVTEKNIHNVYTETLTNSAENGIISQRDFFDKDISNNANLDGYYVVKNDAFVYNPRISTTAPVGPIKRNKLGRTGVMSPLYYIFQTHDIDNTFLETYFSTRYWHQFMKLNGDSGARADRFAIKDAVLKEMPIPYPANEEQQCIGVFFKQVDNIIILHQRKLAHLQAKKKCLLQKMFPKKGERFPELRFPGFTDDWEQRKVIDVAPLQRGFDLPTSKMELGKYPVVMSNGINGVHSEYKVKAPGVVTGRSGTIGRLHYIEEDFWPHNTTLWVTDFKRNNPLYVYYMYQNLDLSRFSVGSGVPTLNRNDVHNAVVYIPILKEQTCISQFFKSLDNLITLHERKLAHLQTQKKALLQQMFV